MPDAGGDGVEVRVHKEGSPKALVAAAGAGTVTGAALAAGVLRALGRRRRSGAREGAREGDSVPVDPMAETGELDHPSPRTAEHAVAGQKPTGDATGELKAWVARG